jgi:hypothetical protein
VELGVTGVMDAREDGFAEEVPDIPNSTELLAEGVGGARDGSRIGGEGIDRSDTEVGDARVGTA